MSRPLAIAIDGPSASGKSTLARALAERLGYLFLDTGLMYRAVTLAALGRGVELADEAAVVRLAGMCVIDVVPPTVEDGRSCTVYLDGDDVTRQLHSAEVDAGVSIPSAYAGVRAALTRQQQRIGERGRVVLAGRDIGTVVLPEAELKIYLDAPVEVRARRRWLECQADGRPDTYEEILAAMRRRDGIDSQRAVAPLHPAEDAVILDTTDLDARAVLDCVLKLVNSSSSAGDSRSSGGSVGAKGRDHD